MTTEWVVAAVFVIVGLVAAVGFWWGNRDPIVRRYKPGSGGFFRIGRTLPRPEFNETLDRNDKDANDGRSGRK